MGFGPAVTAIDVVLVQIFHILLPVINSWKTAAKPRFVTTLALNLEKMSPTW